MIFELMNEGLTLVQTMVASSPSEAPAAGIMQSEDSLENLVPIIAIVLGCTVAIVAILAAMLSNNQREKTRREIAAYVAEGSISPQDAEAMMSAGSTKPSGSWKPPCA